MIPMTKARAEELIVPLKNGQARDISNAWRARLIEALEYVIQHDRPADLCEWKSDPDGYWSTQCGKGWVFEAGGPVENEMRYCPICGKVIFIADEPAKDAGAGACQNCGSADRITRSGIEQCEDCGYPSPAYKPAES